MTDGVDSAARRAPRTRRTGSRPPTILDVARAAGVSSATVSRVVNGTPSVNEVLAERVRATVRELDYVPSGTARSLSSGVTRTVAMLVPDLGNPMFHQVFQGLHTAAAADGYLVLVADSQEDAGKEAVLVRDARKRCDAAVLCAPRMGDAELADVLAGLAPAVVVNRESGVPGVCSVSVDYEAGIVAVAEYLISLGHRRLAYLAGPSRSASQRARERGLARIATQHPGVAVVQLPCGSTMEDGYQAWPAVEASGASAVMAFNDVVALGLLGRLGEQRVRVPEQLSVTGFDDIMFARFSSPSLTTVSVDLPGTGRVVWATLRAAIDGQAARPSTVFRPQLIVRGSTGVAPRTAS
ncbi:LacI family DNA-binding transcriptional regulator [Kineococcus sp. SYSU DK003]|uniref:LacI family DNA-binding transcriptional regulator n=1 Tax=Kineococcus sp. SYSU DK003 TaxID=3383124 RepID=UPI003D7DA506